MLPLDRQVTSLALSKRLAEAGLPTETLFYWWKYKREPDTEWAVGYQREFDDMEVEVPAYTASELLEWLRPYSWQMTRGQEGYVVDLLYIDHLERVVADTPAEAIGELALKVKEGGR